MGGIRKTQFEHAKAIIQQLRDGLSPNIDIFGPTFSGSLPSLEAQDQQHVESSSTGQGLPAFLCAESVDEPTGHKLDPAREISKFRSEPSLPGAAIRGPTQAYVFDLLVRGSKSFRNSRALSCDNSLPDNMSAGLAHM